MNWRKYLSWILYWLGDKVSLVLNLVPDQGKISASAIGILYPIYNKLMLWSSDVQADGEGPWSAWVEDTPEVEETPGPDAVG
jgi:hypothetical protein